MQKEYVINEVYKIPGFFALESDKFILQSNIKDSENVILYNSILTLL